MDTELSLKDYLAVLRRRWPLLIGTLAAVLVLALLYSLLSTPMYRADATLLIDSQQTTAGILPDQQSTRSDQERIVQTEVEFIESLSVQRAVDDILGAETEINARAASDANVIELVATDDDPEDAALIANTYADVYIQLRRERAIAEFQESATVVQANIDNIDSQLEDLGDEDAQRVPLERQRDIYVQALESLRVGQDLFGGVKPQIISVAEPPEAAFSPQTLRNMVLAAVVGLILGVGVALLRETLDTSIRTKSDLEAVSEGLPTLALVPSADGWKKEDEATLLSLSQPNGDQAEAYRTLRTALQFLALDDELQVIQVTSPKPGEGKSTTTANLAVAYARAGRRVVVVDCDLRKPRAHKFFGVRPEPGVTNILLGQMEPGEAARRPIADLALLIIPAGAFAPNPSEVLGSKAMYNLVEKLRKSADIVLIDSPPVLPVADPRVLADKVDATILVSQSKGSDTHDVGRALELLRQVNAPLVGTVLNRVGKRAGEGYGYSYRYNAPEAVPERGTAASNSGNVGRDDTIDLGLDFETNATRG